LIPSSDIAAVFAFVSNKLAIYSWNFADILIGVLSRAIYFRFKALGLTITEKLKQTGTPGIYLFSRLQISKDM